MKYLYILKSHRKALLVIGAGVFISFMMSFAKPTPGESDQTEALRLVDALQVYRHNARVPVKSQGFVRPHREVILTAEITGKVVQSSPAFVAGGFFRAGEVMLTIEAHKYRHQLDMAKAELARAHREWEMIKADAGVALDQWKNNKPTRQTQKAKELFLKEPHLKEALANIKQAESAVEVAKIELDRTQIRAPYDGMLESNKVELGQHISKGQEIALFYASDYAIVKLPLSEIQSTQIDLPSPWTDQQAQMTNQQAINRNYPKVVISSQVNGVTQTWLGRLVRTEEIINENNRQLVGVARISDPYKLYGANKQRQRLRLGTFVEAKIEGKQLTDVIALPRKAVGNDSSVWVIDKEQRLHKREISLLNNYGRTLYIHKGLDDGETIVLNQSPDYIEGLKVSVVAKPQLPMTASIEAQAQP